MPHYHHNKSMVNKCENTLRPASTHQRSVSFNQVKIREYEMTLGDNPACKNGPPVTIGWKYSEEYVSCIDDYENLRGAPRTKYEMVMPPSVRCEIIEKAGITFNEIRDRIRMNQKINRGRIQSSNNFKYHSFEMKMEYASTKMKSVQNAKKKYPVIGQSKLQKLARRIASRSA